MRDERCITAADTGGRKARWSVEVRRVAIGIRCERREDNSTYRDVGRTAKCVRPVERTSEREVGRFIAGGGGWPERDVGRKKLARNYTSGRRVEND